MFRDVTEKDRGIFLEMAEKFYSSDAVSHTIERHILEATFDTALNKSPLMRAVIIENDGTPAGFALLAFSYATEVGGLVVLLEDIYVSEACRGKGIGGKFLQFMESEYPSAKRYRLEVAKDNTGAINLYTRAGYKKLDYVQMVKDI
jgi:GNAT superfamily N-acetyltransferase